MITFILLWLLFDNLFSSGHSETYYIEKRSDSASNKGRSVTRIKETKPDGTIIEGESRWTSGHSKEDDTFLGLRESK